MVKQVRDLPENAAIATMGVKLRAAREEAGKSRATVQKETGISAKALEHYEAGTSEVSISRLEQLCKLYGLEMKEVLPIDVGGSAGEFPRDENADAGGMPIVEAMLADLAAFRVTGFDGAQRRAMALVDELATAMKRLESDELEALAEARELFEGDRPTSDGIFGLFVEDVDEAQRYCGLVEERIVDTAILGSDLYAIDREALVKVADAIKDEFDIEEPRFLGWSDCWGDYAEFVPLIREPLRKLALMGKGMDLANLDQFPRRELEAAA
ncbi:helix-turn-helix domain-containing protein [Thalassospira lucentensis]|uniref:helix-turn-helix domain-containing protein n=1 Tax=Thalassospira lucentensis TaxID=168935 RepID=UPI003AA9C159